MTTPPPELRKAQRHLARRDPVLKQVIATIGPCTLWFNPDRFGLLARSIVAQQISGKAATSISARLVEALAPRGLTPEGILAVSEETLRGAGLSTAKARSIRDLAEKVHGGEVPLHDIHELEDEAVVARLLPVRGIGRWTVQMFLIFSLGRLDVLPVGDFGLRAAVQRLYELPELPAPARLEELARPWQPYRAVATWYFWRSLGGVPQSS
jgi:DNA-3-methyladenine glycosylase II